jgi:hypothetical protein
MTKHLILFLALNLIVFSSGCNDATDNVEEGKSELVIVRDQRGLDGCGFLLQGSDSVWFNPVNLDSVLMKDGLSIRIRYKKMEDLISICMKGESIELLSQQVVKP